MAKLHYKTHFNDSWLDEDDFKAWIKKVPGNNDKFYCQWYRFTWTSNTGKQVLVRHSKIKCLIQKKKDGNLNIQSYSNCPKNHQTVTHSCSPLSSTLSPFKNNL